MGHLRQDAREHCGALSLCVALLATALPCGGSAQPAHAGHVRPVARVPDARLPNSVVSEGGAFALALDTSPNPIRLNELFELTIVARPLAGDGRGPLSVSLDATMPAHRHGMNTRPYREQIRDDQFLFRGILFHMAGEWELVIDAVQGGVRDRAVVRLVIE
jgi:hypothetical protein